MSKPFIVETKTVEFAQGITLASGRTIAPYTLAYETYGKLNKARNNAILICHALTGDQHAAGVYDQSDKQPGWWNHYIGPGKAIDTDRFYVVALNNLGGCSGSTGTNSTDPDTGKLYGASFPSLRVRDWVQSQHQLMGYLGIEQWAAIVGGSLGGMQAMRWAIDYPDKMRAIVAIATASKLTAQNIAFNEIARQAITSDPAFNDGNYGTNQPKDGLSLARMVGHVTYLSGDAMGRKFGRDLKAGTFQANEFDAIEFQVQSYLRYQGEQFSNRFDANTYILFTRALDYFDLARDFDGNLAKAFSQTQAAFLVVSFSSDWRFSPQRSQEITDALITANNPVSYINIDTDMGHDAFLLPNIRYEQAVHDFLRGIDR